MAIYSRGGKPIRRIPQTLDAANRDKIIEMQGKILDDLLAKKARSEELSRLEMEQLKLCVDIERQLVMPLDLLAANTLPVGESSPVLEVLSDEELLRLAEAASKKDGGGG